MKTDAVGHAVEGDSALGGALVGQEPWCGQLGGDRRAGLNGCTAEVPVRNVSGAD